MEQAPRPAAAGPEAGSTPKPVDFVCEADVRAALGENRTICIGPRTIVTPAARDLAGGGGVLALVKG
ncbi:MAG: hypothetical protein LAQ30_30485 [Acidobacteriia bacterium]|nr:hypothetical protein [Terriglobia bacterium]